MSQLLIQQYLNQLQTLKRVSGTTRESVVREAFKDLLEKRKQPVGLKAALEESVGASQRPKLPRSVRKE